MDLADEIHIGTLQAIATEACDAWGNTHAVRLTEDEHENLLLAIELIRRLQAPHRNSPERRGWLLPHEEDLHREA